MKDKYTKSFLTGSVVNTICLVFIAMSSCVNPMSSKSLSLYFELYYLQTILLTRVSSTLL